MPARPTTGSRPTRSAPRSPRSSTAIDGRPHDVRRALLDGTRRRPLSHIGVEVTDSAYAVTSHRHHDPRGHRGAARDRRRGAPWSDGALRRCAARSPARRTFRGPATTRSTSSTSPTRSRSGRTAPATAATRILAQEVLRAADRLGDRPRRGLARRAHAAHPRSSTPLDARTYLAAAFPSACGKTNLAMLRPTDPRLARRDHRRRHRVAAPGEDGRLPAINPEAGFFGVAPAPASPRTPTAVETLWGNTIFTNVALRPDGDVWWEGLTDEPPAELTDWEGEPWTPGIRPSRRAPELALHGRCGPVPADRRRLGRPAGRAARRDPLRRTPRHERAAGRRGARLDPRRLHGLDDLVRAHRRGRGHRRRAPPRPVRDAAVLRLQHGRLLRPLAEDRAEAAVRPRADASSR